MGNGLLDELSTDDDQNRIPTEPKPEPKTVPKPESKTVPSSEPEPKAKSAPKKSVPITIVVDSSPEKSPAKKKTKEDEEPDSWADILPNLSRKTRGKTDKE